MEGLSYFLYSFLITYSKNNGEVKDSNEEQLDKSYNVGIFFIKFSFRLVL